MQKYALKLITLNENGDEDPDGNCYGATIEPCVDNWPGAVYLASEVDAEREKDKARIAELEAGLRALMRGYVSTLEAGRDRIIQLDGTCDSVEVMERGDPCLIAAKKLVL